MQCCCVFDRGSVDPISVELSRFQGQTVYSLSSPPSTTIFQNWVYIQIRAFLQIYKPAILEFVQFLCVCFVIDRQLYGEVSTVEPGGGMEIHCCKSVLLGFRLKHCLSI